FRHIVEDIDAPSPWPLVKTGDDEFAEWAYDVTIPVRGDLAGVMDALWPMPDHPTGTRVVEEDER
ncbi:hypothetical protein ACSNN7_29165, partial [Micromonospora sp. URMC 105]|uniref:hypothetical protein n=1 Tax=Micromonospora sp. URMC 105 TaxID=3423413 RepID=UPI003F1DBD3B